MRSASEFRRQGNVLDWQRRSGSLATYWNKDLRDRPPRHNYRIPVDVHLRLFLRPRTRYDSLRLRSDSLGARYNLALSRRRGCRSSNVSLRCRRRLFRSDIHRTTFAPLAIHEALVAFFRMMHSAVEKKYRADTSIWMVRASLALQRALVDQAKRYKMGLTGTAQILCLSLSYGKNSGFPFAAFPFCGVVTACGDLSALPRLPFDSCWDRPGRPRSGSVDVLWLLRSRALTTSSSSSSDDDDSS